MPVQTVRFLSAPVLLFPFWGLGPGMSGLGCDHGISLDFWCLMFIVSFFLTVLVLGDAGGVGVTDLMGSWGGGEVSAPAYVYELDGLEHK